MMKSVVVYRKFQDALNNFRKLYASIYIR